MLRCKDAISQRSLLFSLSLSLLLPTSSSPWPTKIDIIQAEISLILSAQQEEAEEAAGTDRRPQTEGRERRISPEETIKYSNNLRVSYKLKRIAIKNPTPVSSVFTTQKPHSHTHSATHTLTLTHTQSGKQGLIASSNDILFSEFAKQN